MEAGATGWWRRRDVTMSIVIGVVLSIIGIVWIALLDDSGGRARCGYGWTKSQFQLSWTLAVLAPYVFCLVRPAVLTRTPDGSRHLRGAGWLGFLAFVLTTLVVSSNDSTDYDAQLLADILIALALPLFGLLTVWKMGSTRGRVLGYLLGFFGGLTFLVMVYAWTNTCS